MKINNVLIGLLLLAVACSSDTRETPNGYKFKTIREGDGNVAKPGQFIMINMMFKDAQDSIWGDTRDQPVPMVMAIDDESVMDKEKGINEIFRMLSKGDSVVCTVPANTVFGGDAQSQANGVDPASEFTFYLGVKDVMDSAQMQALQQRVMEEQRALFLKNKKEQLLIDSALIQNHLDEKGIVAERTESGLRYKINKKGTGPQAKPGDNVRIHYAGYLLDGTLFDTSMASAAKEAGSFTEGRPYDPLSLVAGQGQVIPGWEEAILLMNKGAKMRVWIPSSLAYGPQKRNALIKENTVLVFDMEMVAIN